jgi:hypothetical protein
VWIDDVFICDASVEGLVAFRRLLEANHLNMDDKLNDAGIGGASRTVGPFLGRPETYPESAHSLPCLSP